MVSAQLLGVDVVLRGISDLTPRVKFAAYTGIFAALQIAERESRVLLSASDHTLADLAKMGHPYSRRRPNVPHDPLEIIHAQSGAYLSALKATPPKGFKEAIVEGTVGIVGGGEMKRLDEWLQLGTSKMIPRPWAALVRRAHGDQMQKVMLAEIRAALPSAGAA